ncbi:MAG: hypothetical protein K8T26_19770 [Lentisphaerae bacterium]|nr:hypothetical protein [Lentisphaerota bacterium]
MNASVPHLRVLRAELVKALKVLVKTAKPRKVEQAILLFDGRCLHIEVSGVTATCAADGEWPGQARVAVGYILGLAKLPPKEDPINFRVEGTRLHFGATFSCTCVWQAPWLASVQLPVNCDEGMLLALKRRYTDKQIEESGLARAVAGAEASRERHIAKALKSLGRYHVKAEDLRALIDQSLSEDGTLRRV